MNDSDAHAAMLPAPVSGGYPPSMADVAQYAGVSHQTVSRVLNDLPNVRPATKERVLAAIEHLGYRRNSAARALATRKSGVLGVVSSRSGLYGPTSTMIGVEVAARQAGYFVSVVTVAQFDAASMGRVVDHFMAQGVEGVIVIAPQLDATRAVAGLAISVPVVMISSTGVRAQTDGTAMLRSVSVDQVRGAQVITDHLIGAGHKDVVHVAGPQDWLDARARVAGWQAAMERAGLTAQAPVTGDWTAERGYDVGREMARQGAPSAVFAANDQLALGLLRALWEAGVRIPEDVSVAGFDDEPGAANYIPPLTTVRQDFTALGRLAIESLTAMLRGEDPATTPLVPTLMVRASTVRPS